MFSSDKNIERIADFVEEAKNWFTIRKEYTKIEIIDKVVQIGTALTLAIVFAFMLLSKDMAGAKILTEAAKAQETTSAESTGGSWIDDEEVSADNAVIEAVEDSEVPALETEVPAAE